MLSASWLRAASSEGGANPLRHSDERRYFGRWQPDGQVARCSSERIARGVGSLVVGAIVELDECEDLSVPTVLNHIVDPLLAVAVSGRRPFLVTES